MSKQAPLDYLIKNAVGREPHLFAKSMAIADLPPMSRLDRKPPKYTNQST